MEELSYGNGTFSILFIVGDWAQSRPGPGWHFILIGDLSKYSQSKEELDMSGDGQTHGLGFDVSETSESMFFLVLAVDLSGCLFSLFTGISPGIPCQIHCFLGYVSLKVPFIFHYAVDDENRSLTTSHRTRESTQKFWRKDPVLNGVKQTPINIFWVITPGKPFYFRPFIGLQTPFISGSGAHYLGDMLVPCKGRSRLVGKSLQQTECLSYEAGRPAWQASTLLN